MIPAFNEAGRLGGTLDAYLPVLERMGIPYEVIVVADGTDRTPEVARSFESRGVACYEYPYKLGRGGAILEGFRRAKNPIIAFADADGSIPGKDLDHMVTLVRDGWPVVVASRRLDPSVVVVPEPAFRRAVGFVWHLMVRVLLGLRLHDAQCGLKVFSADVVHKVILRRLTVTNRTFEVGMMYHVAHDGVSILEVPVSYVHSYDTRMPIGKAVPVMFLTLLGISAARLWSRNGSKPPPFLVQLNRRFAAT